MARSCQRSSGYAAKGAAMGRRGPKPKPQIITTEQTDVLKLVAEGLTNPEIAARLGHTKYWVMDQLKVAFRILGARSRAQAVLKAVAEGVLDSPERPRHPGVKPRVRRSRKVRADE